MAIKQGVGFFESARVLLWAGVITGLISAQSAADVSDSLLVNDSYEKVTATQAAGKPAVNGKCFVYISIYGWREWREKRAELTVDINQMIDSGDCREITVYKSVENVFDVRVTNEIEDLGTSINQKGIRFIPVNIKNNTHIRNSIITSVGSGEGANTGVSIGGDANLNGVTIHNRTKIERSFIK